MTAREALQRYWHYDDFRPLQGEVVESVLAGRDTLALMPTGGGNDAGGYRALRGHAGRGSAGVVKKLNVSCTAQFIWKFVVKITLKKRFDIWKRSIGS